MPAKCVTCKRDITDEGRAVVVIRQFKPAGFACCKACSTEYRKKIGYEPEPKFIAEAREARQVGVDPAPVGRKYVQNDADRQGSLLP